VIASESSWSIRWWEVALWVACCWAAIPVAVKLERWLPVVFDGIIAGVRSAFAIPGRVYAWFRLTPAQRHRWWNVRRSERALAVRMRTW
jgi:hypothetical protein